MWVQPSAPTVSGCPVVSTPSAVVVMLRSAAMSTTALMMEDEPEASVSSCTKLRSIFVEGKALQVAQRGVTGAEVVERDVNPELAQLIEGRKRGIVVENQYRFRDLKLEAARVEAGVRERSRNIPRQRLRSEMDGRNVG